MQDKVLKYYPQKIAETKLMIEALGKDLPIVEAHPVKDDAFSITIMGKEYTERKAAGQAIINTCRLMTDPDKPMDLGEYRGFPMRLSLRGQRFVVSMKQNLTYTAELSDDPVGNIIRINNALEGMAENIKRNERALATLESEMETAKEESEQPFPKEAELQEKNARLAVLNRELSKPSHSGEEQSKEDDQDQETDFDGEEAPAPVAAAAPKERAGTPSIRQALRNFTPPAPVPSRQERGQRQEVAL